MTKVDGGTRVATVAAVAALPERLRAKIAFTSGCWEWLGYRAWHGYGRFYDGRRMVYTHRHLYEALVGPIPPGLQIDHLCRVRACCNPAHLEPVTARVNLLRAPASAVARGVSKTHCWRGHPFNETNTHIDRHGNRSCRACWKVRRDERKAATSAVSA